jgi:hypothetical protein
MTLSESIEPKNPPVGEGAAPKPSARQGQTYPAPALSTGAGLSGLLQSKLVRLTWAVEKVFSVTP